MKFKSLKGKLGEMTNGQSGRIWDKNGAREQLQRRQVELREYHNELKYSQNELEVDHIHL